MFPVISQHSVEGLTSLEVAAWRLPTIHTPTIILSVIEMRSTCIVASPATFFCLGIGAQGVVATAIWVMGSKYLNASKKVDFDAVEAMI